ncbi:dihydropyrimidinase [Ferrovibrio sp.]|uniref:dihydropyrimidinase n=1 Tax=Ferrovibrio sp. TaxID=1917215 RepID=UPI001B7C5D83|nr:dihydropyrimidinase [Ferrovibrio sp.]MBP7064313.1 dihydropyrimidinase [Ferrovibrio sp.]
MSANFDLVIRDARIATAADTMVCDLGIRNGVISALGQELGAGQREINAAGRLVLPGGIDAHCHLDQPMSDGSVMADDFASGTLSAACGGTTTVIPFACQMKGQSLRAALIDYHARAEGKALIDYAFHLIVSDPTASVLGQELPALIGEGYTSFKIYMTYDDLKLNDRQILETLDVARREGAMAMIHAENTDAIAWLTERLELAGRIAPKYHAVARPLLVEREATHRAISFAELVDVPILIVHVSGREAVEQIRWAQSRGLRIHAETCPQYLFLSAENLDRPGHDGAMCICSPPPRDKANQEVIWAGLRNGTFDIVSSDHAPFKLNGPTGKKVAGEGASFSKIPNGIPGLETRMALLLSEGVLKGRITLQQFVALTATNAAKLYGLYPRKGSIAIGSDADIVIWDTSTSRTISNAMLHHNVDYTPYEGMEISAWPDTVISRGEVIVDDGKPVGHTGRGQFLTCARPQSRG